MNNVTNSTETAASFFETLPRVVAIVGSRSFPYRHWIDAFVDRLRPETIIVSGGAKGVDKWAELAAYRREMTTKIFPILSWEWDIFGKKAGIIRNTTMLTYVQHVGGHIIIFSHDDAYGHIRGGTRHSYDLATELKIPFTVYHAA